MSLATPEKIRKLQRALYVKAKQEPTRRFHFLYDKVWREEIFAYAYACGRAPWDEVVEALNRTVRGWAAYFSYGSVSKARHAVDLHLYHSVRAFLRRRHKVAGSGCRQFPAERVFGELGVIAFDPTYRRRPAHASL